MTTETRTGGLHIENLTVEFGDHRILDHAGLTLPSGQILAVNGASGCGKTTLLRAIAGLVPMTTGTIHLDGRRIESLPAHRRGVVYLNQEPLLFPHLNVFDNVAFGLRLRHVPRPAVRTRVTDMLARLDLDGMASRRPDQLSGGQKQRVAFGRALIVEPPLLLLDEPFSSLDPDTRKTMQALFHRVAGERDITAVFVTHDLRETLTMGDQLAMMRAGKLHTYPDRTAFSNDPATGVAGEAAFWRSALQAGSQAPQSDEDVRIL